MRPRGTFMNLRQLSLAAALILMPFAVSAQSQLKPILDQMDAASARFKSAQADVRYDNYTRVVNDHDIETGSIYIERAGATEQMGAAFYNVGAGNKPSSTPARI